MLAGKFYLLLGVIGVGAAIGIYHLTTRLGYYYLSIGMSVFSLYMLIKGSGMIYFYRSRQIYYHDTESIDRTGILEERQYTRWRVYKKKRNRRRYIYALIAAVVCSFLGLFHQEKGLIIATCIPVMLMSAVEFTVGLLTEFRLSEYLKHLHKLSQKLGQN